MPFFWSPLSTNQGFQIDVIHGFWLKLPTSKCEFLHLQSSNPWKSLKVGEFCWEGKHFLWSKRSWRKIWSFFFGGWWNRMKFADRLAGLVASHESKTCGHKHDSPNRNIAMGWFWTYPQVIDLRWKKYVCQWVQVAGFLAAAWEPVSGEVITKWLYTLQIETWIISSKLATVVFFVYIELPCFFFRMPTPKIFSLFCVFSPQPLWVTWLHKLPGTPWWCQGNWCSVGSWHQQNSDPEKYL